MKKFLTLLLASSCALAAQAAHFGASAGWLVDSEEAYFSARGGLTLKATSAAIHSAELEVGYSDQSEGSLDASILPVTANYRAEFVNAGNFSPFVGLGVGAARITIDTWFGDDDDITFAAQVFAGVSYKASETVSLNLAARYIWIDSAELLGIDIELGDDVAIEAGISFKF